jgi:hypothetical protein
VLLNDAGRTDVLEVEPRAADLNAWLTARGHASFTLQMRMSVGLASTGLGRVRRGRSIA